MPLQWMEVLGHPTVKDKVRMLEKLKYEYTVNDVYDLIEYLNWENWQNFEEYEKEKERSKNANR
jgi:hypothetical protein